MSQKIMIYKILGQFLLVTAITVLLLLFVNYGQEYLTFKSKEELDNIYQKATEEDLRLFSAAFENDENLPIQHPFTALNTKEQMEMYKKANLNKKTDDVPIEVFLPSIEEYKNAIYSHLYLQDGESFYQNTYDSFTNHTLSTKGMKPSSVNVSIQNGQIISGLIQLRGHTFFFQSDGSIRTKQGNL